MRFLKTYRAAKADFFFFFFPIWFFWSLGWHMVLLAFSRGMPIVNIFGIMQREIWHNWVIGEGQLCSHKTFSAFKGIHLCSHCVENSQWITDCWLWLFVGTIVFCCVKPFKSLNCNEYISNWCTGILLTSWYTCPLSFSCMFPRG